MLYHYKARITKVYDGDTITADIDLGFDTWLLNQKVRLFGINAPEVRGAERTEGLRSREALHNRIGGRHVMVNTIKDKKGKYGRWLARIFLDSEDINEWMVKNGYAKHADY